MKNEKPKHLDLSIQSWINEVPNKKGMRLFLYDSFVAILHFIALFLIVLGISLFGAFFPNITKAALVLLLIIPIVIFTVSYTKFALRKIKGDTKS